MIRLHFHEVWTVCDQGTPPCHTASCLRASSLDASCTNCATSSRRLPLDSKARDSRLVDEHVANETIGERRIGRRVLEPKLLRVVLRVDVVADADELLIRVRGRQQDHRDADQVGRRDLRWRWRSGLGASTHFEERRATSNSNELTPAASAMTRRARRTDGDRADHARVELLVVALVLRRAHVDELPLDVCAVRRCRRRDAPSCNGAMHSKTILNRLHESAGAGIARTHYGAANAERGSSTLTSTMFTAAMLSTGCWSAHLPQLGLRAADAALRTDASTRQLAWTIPRRRQRERRDQTRRVARAGASRSRRIRGGP